MFGARPVLGRLLGEDDDRTGAAPVAVISYAAWHAQFGGAPDVIGRRLRLPHRNIVYTIVGIGPPGLEFPRATDLWVPLVTFARLEVVPVGRLRPGVTPAQAASDLRVSFTRGPQSAFRNVRAAAVPLPSVIAAPVRPALIVLTLAASLLLCMACANASTLLLVRGAGRAQEISVRRALGAGGGRLVGQAFTEHAILVGAGGLLGVVLANGLLRALIAYGPPELPRLDEVRLHGVPVIVALAACTTATLACGLLPALWVARKRDLSVEASGRTATVSRATRRTHHALVVLQVAVAVVLLTAAGLLGRTLHRLQQLSTGFATDRVSIVELAWPGDRFDAPHKVRTLYDRVISQLAVAPGIISASPVNVAPFTGATAGWDGPFVAAGRAVPDVAPVLNMAVVGADYFRTLEIPLLAGRGFTDADRERHPRVAIVSHRVARLFWPGDTPLGKRIAFSGATKPDEWWTVVGLVPETRYRMLREPSPTVYLPYRQFPDEAIGFITTLAVRTDRDGMEPSIRSAIHAADPDVAVARTEPLTQMLARELAQPRFGARLIGIFSIGALALAAVGVYAVLALLVRQRCRELAIRQALGATPWAVRVLVFRRAATLGVAGVLAGSAGALASARGIEASLYEVAPTDPLTVVAVAAVLLVVTAIAGYVPARRAGGIDPAVVLRAE